MMRDYPTFEAFKLLPEVETYNEEQRDKYHHQRARDWDGRARAFKARVKRDRKRKQLAKQSKKRNRK